MKKVLLFGLGFQGLKYYKYFNHGRYIIDVVTKNGINIKQLKNISNIYSFGNILKININFNKYEFIVISVNPLSEQEKVIIYLLNRNISLNTKIIIEKEVSNNIKTVSEMISKNNIIYHIDELILSEKLINFFGTNNLKLSICKDIHYLDHAIGCFLLLDNFELFLKELKIIFLDNRNIPYYKYSNLNKKYVFLKGQIYINDIKYIDLNFDKNIDFFINNMFYNKNNLLCKKNYLIWKIFLLNNFKMFL